MEPSIRPAARIMQLQTKNFEPPRCQMGYPPATQWLPPPATCQPDGLFIPWARYIPPARTGAANWSVLIGAHWRSLMNGTPPRWRFRLFPLVFMGGPMMMRWQPV